MAIDALPAVLSPSTARAAMAAVLGAMMSLADAVREAGSWPDGERRRLLGDLDRAVEGLSAVRATMLVAERESGAWRDGGDRSFEAWRSRVARTTQRSAQAQVREAEQLRTVPTALDAVTAGRITLDHATALARVASDGTPAQQKAMLDQDAQEGLLALAERTDAGTFAVAVASWAATVDPAGLERDHQAQRRERHLHLSETPHGTFIKGRLDAMAGHRVALALEALTPRPAADDDRDLGQRRADALDTMAGRILADSDTKPGGHVPPHVSLIVSAETWVAARAERDRRRRSASVAGSPSTVGELMPCEGPPSVTPPATLEDGTPVPISELAVAMCDCAVTRVAVDAAGTPLDLGRTARLFTGPQRRAVIARDRECIWDDCHMPARWCQIHHARWWERDGGRTSVENGVLLCSFHHHEVHRRDLAVVRLRVRPEVHEPPGRRSRTSAPPGTVARASYEIRDRLGVLVGRPATRHGPEPGDLHGQVVGGPVTRPGPEPPPDPDPEPPPPRRGASARVTDPFTGISVPQLWADP